ncbi:hypothetical protein BGZ95_003426 [Linnemannia exigua]|uniref:Uncharacterized protein n=1 Tax=Linnemannia exigua TaxID=604196 RepID=A0AAD4D469_9FUNG|nr:hypothetical protein BGZ95_003426 [Linnemannia exigua]
MARNAVPPKEMNLMHSNTGHWEYVIDSRAPYGLAAKLVLGLWWLDISAMLYGVLPGRYWVQWGLALSNTSSLNRSQFRVAAFSRDEIPIWNNEAKNSIDYRPESTRNFFHHTTATNKDLLDPNEAFIFQLPQTLVVEKEKPTLFAQMREHHSYKNGITVLFVRIVPAGDGEVDAKEFESDEEDR